MMETTEILSELREKAKFVKNKDIEQIIGLSANSLSAILKGDKQLPMKHIERCKLYLQGGLSEIKIDKSEKPKVAPKKEKKVIPVIEKVEPLKIEIKANEVEIEPTTPILQNNHNFDYFLAKFNTIRDNGGCKVKLEGLKQELRESCSKFTPNQKAAIIDRCNNLIKGSYK